MKFAHRFVGVLLGLATAATMGVLFASPAEAGTRTPTLRITSATSEVTVGNKVALSGTINYAKKHRYIYIQRRYTGASNWSVVKRVGASRSTGKWSTTITIYDSRQFDYRIYMPKHRGYRKAYSSTVHVNVSTQASLTSIPYKYVVGTTNDLAVGESRIAQMGANGTKKVYYRNGQYIEEIVKAPKDFIIENGLADPIPTVRSASPASGPVEGGNTVTLTGILLGGVTKVVVGGVEATGLVVDSTTKLHFVAPVQVEGTYEIQVYAGDALLTTPSVNYTYTAIPEVTSFSPAKGSLEGGTTVKLAGKHLDKVTDIQFDGISGTDLSISPTSLKVTTPAHGAGPVSVTLLNGTNVVATKSFTYLVIPKAHLITPGSGRISGGTRIAIIGTGFAGVTKVTFTPIGLDQPGWGLDNMPAVDGTELSVWSDNTLYVKTPQNLPGLATISLVNANGSTDIGTFTYKTVDRSIGSASTLEQQILAELSAARSVPQNCGGTAYPAVGPLAWDDTTAEFAYTYSKDSVLRSGTYMSMLGGMTTHNWPGLEAANWKFMLAGWDENDGRNEIVQAAGANITAKQIVQGWLNSASHCSTLMRPGYTKAGVGQFSVSNNNGFATVEFR